MGRFVFVSLLLVSAAAWAQQEGGDSDDDKPAAAAQEKGNLNVSEKGPQRMTWSGFQVKDGVPTVFLELTSAPEYRVEDAPGEVVVTLKNTVVPLRNNRRALDVRGFETAVKEVSTQPKGKDVRVTIKTKSGDRPSHHERVEDAAGGFRMLVIELPAK